jgi:hypothetical protein
MKLIGFSGEAGAGKDTAYLMAQEYLNDWGHSYTKLSFADKLKDICVLLFGWDRVRLDHDVAYKEGNTNDDGTPDLACQLLGKTRRQVMQEIGTEAMRDGLHKDVWVIVKMIQISRGEFNQFDYMFLTDCRFLNEMKFVRSLGGVLVKLERVDENGQPYTHTTRTAHASEQEWRQWDDWDYVIQNYVDPKLSEAENRAVFKRNLAQIFDTPVI